MKKIYLYIATVALLTFGSCSDSFLDSNPKTGSTEGTFYKTKSDAEKALVGCYDGLQQIWSSGVSFPLMSEICSDNCYAGVGNGDALNYQAIEELNPLRAPSYKDLFNDNWKAYYNAIFRCNTLLVKLDGIDWEGDDAAKLSVECQTRFLRAYFYFDMVRIWENIPLLTEPSDENLPQADPDEVYAVIASDLKYAIDNMNSQAYSSSWAEKNDGRATKWAAQALLARVYLFYTGYYGKSDLVGLVSQAEALQGLEDIISNGGYDLVDDFAALWPASAAYSGIDYAGKGNKETIFAIKYNYTSNYDGNSDGNHWLVMMGLRGVMHYPYSQGWGSCTVPERVWNAYSPNDKRRTASIIDIAGEGITQDINDQREYTGYANKKYTPKSVYNDAGELVDEAVDLGAADFQIGQFQDYVVVRYADVLLMAAELGSPNAQNYFDQVRQRAYQAAFTSIPVSQANILEERRLELAFEGIRYWDVLRQGLTQAASILAETTTVQNGGVATQKVIDAANIINTRGFQQIPNEQISQSNGVLEQNSGW
ncbi:RagB/SusD family nutrient uptake outer membrane protein [Dysgonomonas sp. 25]|uniref:RagB/SusD family nutrient uptake outer membrane protein n=1 Tax=Dysgonomonas sp. 25 TaxID=2302933 RepID=UPI0013D3F35B|nr:RagB/SusD family nutrient uptake outer membrane protein [Dysgonomonas sp. 25]NDV67967.1 RagB/SusD family nutrient uptake outer membrane protein [Dysgonomonas sp. 25]